MSCTLTLKRSFPELESCLLDDLAEACQRNPFSRKWVLTSSGTLAGHIKNRLAKRIEEDPTLSLGGIRVVSLSFFASRLFEKVSRKNAAYSSPLNDILLYSLVRGLPESSPLAKVGSIDNGYSLLLPTFRDLADAGFGTENSEFLLEAVRESRISTRELAIVELYLKWIGAVEKLETVWSPLGQQFLSSWLEEAAGETVSSLLSSEAGGSCELFIHGFYDFTDNNLQLISGLSRLLPVTLYFPDNRSGDKVHPAFDFSAEVLENIELRSRLTREAERPVPVPETENPMADYLDRTFPEGSREARPEFISYQKASSPRGEAISAALKVRSWVDEEGIDPADIIVVFTSAGEYLRPVRDAFAAFCLPVNQVDCPVEMSDRKRKLAVLRNIWTGDAPAEWIFQFLRDNPEFCDALGLDCCHFERELRKVIFGGGRNWKEIRHLAGKKPGNRGSLPKLLEPELELIDLIISTWVEKPDFPVSPGTASELAKQISFWLGEEDFLQEAAASFDGMSGFYSAEGITESLFLALVFDSGGIEKTGGDVTLPGVKLIPMMRARGLTCRAMVLMGLSSGVFPRKAEEDYFLGDATRAEVAKRAGDLGHRYRSRLPVKGRLTDEMMLLFYLLNTSAEEIHWVIPETDGAGRLVAPTSWIQSYLQEWGASSPGAPGRIPPGPAEQARYLVSLESDKGSCLPPGYAFLLGLEFAGNLFEPGEGLDYWQAHYASGQMGPEFFGVVSSASSLVRKENLRVTRLERLARCPYMFFAEFLLKLEALQVQEQPFGLNSMEKGSLLHSCLEKVFRESEAIIPTLRRFLRKPDEVENIVEAEMRKNPGLRLVPPLFLRAMRAHLTGVILDYLQYAESTAVEGWCVEGLEHRFEQPFPGLAGVNVRGTADRIDREKESGSLRIIDYKSGRNKEVSGRGRNYQVNLGWRAQAALYPWMREDPGEETDISFSYIFLGEEEKKEVPVEPRTGAEQLLESLRTILEKGNYVPSGKRVMEDCGFPDSLDPCQYCVYQPMCRKSDPGMMVKAGELFKQICRERTEALRLVSGEES